MDTWTNSKGRRDYEHLVDGRQVLDMRAERFTSHRGIETALRRPGRPTPSPCVPLLSSPALRSHIHEIYAFIFCSKMCFSPSMNYNISPDLHLPFKKKKPTRTHTHTPPSNQVKNPRRLVYNKY